MNQCVLLEVCANSVASALAAQSGGAERVELCENLSIGGTTPTYADILLAREQLHIKLYVLIRPRSGDFNYTDAEFKTIIEDVKYCIEAGCDGIVIGLLNTDGTIDKKRCAELMSFAKQADIGVTFHRAFDVCNDQFAALEDIIELGFERILTSGGKDTAMDGAARVAKLITRANGRIIIMPGSGINEANVADLVRITHAVEIHSSARLQGSKSDDPTDMGQVKAILKDANAALG